MTSIKRSKTQTIIGIIMLVLGALRLGDELIARQPIMQVGIVAVVIMLIGVILIAIDHKKAPKSAEQPIETQARTSGNGVYVAWFLFYFILFLVLTGGIALVCYLVTVPIAFSKVAENLWRRVSGIRPLRLKSEKERLAPLFMEVYHKAFEIDANLSQKIKLYIKEDMTINAFAFGKSTLVITRGSLELLSDECLKGLIAHEFGHFSHKDTEAGLLMTVSNFFMSFIMSKLTDRKNRYDNDKNGGVLKAIVSFIYYIFKAIDSIGELILKRKSRQNEYLADEFALKSGFGEELTKVLIEIYSVAIEKPQSVREQFKATHPHITLRIEQLEKKLY